MKCKNCGAEVDGAEKLCPQCGEPLEGSGGPVPKKSKLPVLLISLGLVAAMVVGLIIGGIIPLGGTEPEPEGDPTLTAQGNTTETVNTTQASDTTVPLTLGPEKEAGEIVVVSGEDNATNADLCYYYWEEANSLIYNYGGYGMFDSETAFSLQAYPYDEYVTWHDMLIDRAADMWASYNLLYKTAVAAGHEMDAVYQEYMDSLAERVAYQAEMSGMDTDAYLIAQYGKFASMEGFTRYTEISCVVSSYVNDVYEDILAPYMEHVEMVDSTNIRHILFLTGTEDDEAVKTEADRVYQLFLEDPSEDAFSQLAMEYSEDGNAYLGGIYEGVYPGQMVAEFNDWCFDPARQPGDHGIVQTTYGYHLMYFSGFGEPVAADSSAEEAADAQYNTWIEGLLDAMDYSVNTENVYPW